MSIKESPRSFVNPEWDVKRNRAPKPAYSVRENFPTSANIALRRQQLVPHRCSRTCPIRCRPPRALQLRAHDFDQLSTTSKNNHRKCSKGGFRTRSEVQSCQRYTSSLTS